MKSLEELSQLDRLGRAAELSILARCLMRAGGNFVEARALVANPRTPERVRAIVEKAALGAVSMHDPSSSDMAALSAVFVESLQHLGVFDAVLNGGATRLPLNTINLAITSAILSATVTPEGAARPLSAIGFAGIGLDRKTAVALIAATDVPMPPRAAPAPTSTSMRLATSRALAGPWRTV